MAGALLLFILFQVVKSKLEREREPVPSNTNKKYIKPFTQMVRLILVYKEQKSVSVVRPRPALQSFALHW